MVHLFDTMRLRDVKLPNRVGVAPMCQYCAQPDGKADEWHFVHYGSLSKGGAGLMLLEATAVTPEGRISPYDLGLWCDDQIESLSRIARFSKKHGCVPALQLSHAGRKGSKTQNSGVNAQTILKPEEGGWTVVAPSALAQDLNHSIPEALSVQGVKNIVKQFGLAAARAYQAGFRILELHAAHGYLIHQFLSPIANQREDVYGGEFRNRIRFLLEVVKELRLIWPERLPLFVRISATDWVKDGWDISESIQLAVILIDMGVDLIDVSSGGVSSQAQIPTGPGYQTDFAKRIRQEAGMLTAAVGLITSPDQADHIVRTGQADLVLLGRELLRNPFWPAHAAHKLGHSASWPAQYLRAAPKGAYVHAVLDD